MIQLQVTVTGKSFDDLHRRLLAIADDIKDRQVDGKDDNPDLGHEYHVWDMGE